MSSLLVFLFVWGGGAILLVMNLARDTVLNSCRIWSTTRPQPHTVCITVRLLWEGGELGVGEVREKVDGQQFTRGIESTNMTNCISSLQTELNTSNDDISGFFVHRVK
jgi:hypothetical protein